jgi:hypothetical protein
MPPPIVIFTPMHIEAKAVRRGLRSIGDTRTPIHVIGISAKHLPDPAQLPSGAIIILAGFAGGINPSLNVGDLVLDYALDLPLASGNPHGLKVKRGNIIGRAALVATALEKAEIFTQTQPDAVDMESDVVREFATQHGYRIIGLRAITDRADEDIDPRVIRLVGSFGTPRIGAITLAVLRQPTLMRRLMKLNRGARLAGKSLSWGIAELLSLLAQSSDTA